MLNTCLNSWTYVVQIGVESTTEQLIKQARDTYVTMLS